MNLVILMGRLVREPEVRYSANQMAVASFTVAVDRRYKKDGQQTSDFISCKAFGKTAEFIEKYIRKGTKVAIQGTWQTGNYTNRNGDKVYTNDCLVESIEFAESKGSNTNSQQQNENKNVFMDVPEGFDEELPFE